MTRLHHDVEIKKIPTKLVIATGHLAKQNNLCETLKRGCETKDKMPDWSRFCNRSLDEMSMVCLYHQEAWYHQEAGQQQQLLRCGDMGIG